MYNGFVIRRELDLLICWFYQRYLWRLERTVSRIQDFRNDVPSGLQLLPYWGVKRRHSLFCPFAQIGSLERLLATNRPCLEREKDVELQWKFDQGWPANNNNAALKPVWYPVIDLKTLLHIKQRDWRSLLPLLIHCHLLAAPKPPDNRSHSQDHEKFENYRI